MNKKLLTIVMMVLAFSAAAYAEPVTLNFSVRQWDVAYESINGVPVPTGSQEFAPKFENGETINISISYETNQPDINSDPNIGTYRIGSLSVNIPDIGLSAFRSSNDMQISSFNDTSNPDDQFFVYVSGVDSFSNTVGLPNPTAAGVLLTGCTSMLANDQLPTSPPNWVRGEVSFFFPDSTGATRQVILSMMQNAPVLSSPNDGATDVPLNPKLSWNPRACVAFYLVQVSTDPAFNSTLIEAVTTDPFFKVLPDILNLDMLYYWRVHTVNIGSSDWSSVWSFRTTLGKKELIVKNIGTGRGTVKSAPTGIDCGTRCTKSFPFNTIVNLEAKAKKGTTGLCSTFIGWDVEGCEGTGPCKVTMDRDREVTATFLKGAPSAAGLIEPHGNIEVGTPTFKWKAVSGATQYYLEVKKNSWSQGIGRWYTAADVGCPNGIGTCSVTPSSTIGSLPTGKAAWRIRSGNNVCSGAWSTPMKVTVVTNP